MAVYDTYSKKKKRAEKGDEPDVYQYEALPTHLRRQLVMIFDQAIGHYWSRQSYSVPPPNANSWWDAIDDAMLKEVESYHGTSGKSPPEKCKAFLLINASTIEECLDLVGVVCKVLVQLSGNDPYEVEQRGATQGPKAALAEINNRFKEHAVGYQFENGEIIRIDDQLFHSEVTKPTLALLREPGFEKANEDFMMAHARYMKRDYKGTNQAAGNAFESTLKSICTAHGWEYNKGATAGPLVTLVRNKGLFPDVGKGFDSYVAMMKTGVPEIRNTQGSHGSDLKDSPPPDYVARYMLHLTAANILMLIDAHKAFG